MTSLRRHRRTAFTIIELLAVLVVISILMTLGFLVHGNVRLGARVAVAESKLRQIATGLELYFLKHHTYPPQGSDLTTELAPFIKNPKVFHNPLREEKTPGQDINALYEQRTLREIDGVGTYIVCFPSQDEGSPIICLETGSRITRKKNPGYDPELTQRSSLVAFLYPDASVAGDGQFEELGGRVNLNPRSNDDFEFRLQMPNGSVITRDNLQASNGTLDYAGPATEVRFQPKGYGNQNGLTLDGEPYSLWNATRYTITSTHMTVHLYYGRSRGSAMGHWWIQVSASDGNLEAKSGKRP